MVADCCCSCILYCSGGGAADYRKRQSGSNRERGIVRSYQSPGSPSDGGAGDFEKYDAGNTTPDCAVVLQRAGASWQGNLCIMGSSGVRVSRGLRMRAGYLGRLLSIYFRRGVSVPGRISG